MTIRSKIKYFLEDEGVLEDVKVHNIKIKNTTDPDIINIEIFAENLGYIVGRHSKRIEKLKTLLNAEINLIEFKPFRD